MSHLLKMKSKIGVQRKQRVAYDVADFGKRAREGPADSQILANSNTQPQTQIQNKSPGKKMIKPKIIEKFDTPMGEK